MKRIQAKNVKTTKSMSGWLEALRLDAEMDTAPRPLGEVGTDMTRTKPCVYYQTNFIL